MSLQCIVALLDLNQQLEKGDKTLLIEVSKNLGLLEKLTSFPQSHGYSTPRCV